jgi:hypothetical protein
MGIVQYMVPPQIKIQTKLRHRPDGFATKGCNYSRIFSLKTPSNIRPMPFPDRRPKPWN